MKSLFTILLSLIFFASSAQKENELKAQIDLFFISMQKNDTTMLSRMIEKSCVLKSVYRSTEVRVKNETRASFLQAISEPLPKKWNEKILNYVFYHDDILSTVQTEYVFIYDEQVHHTGINQFTFSYDSTDSLQPWKIISIIDTRYKDGIGDFTMPEEKKAAEKILETKLNDWHRAAADAKAIPFFGFMSDSCIYKGTDKTERWSKKEFYDFAESYFDKGKAWDFKPIERHIYFDDNLQTAWFDEKLDTWMGICKGSGVLRKENGEWKLYLYDLSVTVDNDKIKSFLELTK